MCLTYNFLEHWHILKGPCPSRRLRGCFRMSYRLSSWGSRLINHQNPSFAIRYSERGACTIEGDDFHSHCTIVSCITHRAGCCACQPLLDASDAEHRSFTCFPNKLVLLSGTSMQSRHLAGSGSMDELAGTTMVQQYVPSLSSAQAAPRPPYQTVAQG